MAPDGEEQDAYLLGLDETVEKFTGIIIAIIAEGNTYNDNISRIIEPQIDEHIRAYIRIPNGYRY